MTSTISNEKLNICTLSERLKQIKNMKWILDYKTDDECSYENLHKQIDKLCYENFAHLVVIHNFLTQIPPMIKAKIDNIISLIGEPDQCKKNYFDFIKGFNKNPEYQEYEMYIFVHRSENVLLELSNINENNIEHHIDEIRSAAIKQKSIQIALLFNLLEENERNLYFKGDIMQNLPQFMYWIEKNKNKPIEPLSNDDCEILVGLIYNLSFDEMLDKLNFSSFVKNYSDIDKIINELPNKFHVQNITQVIFRILLIKPYIWRQCIHENIVKAIKGLNNV